MNSPKAPKKAVVGLLHSDDDDSYTSVRSAYERDEHARPSASPEHVRPPSPKLTTTVAMLIAQLQTPSFVVDAQGRIVHANALVEVLLGRALEALVGRSLVEALVPSEQARSAHVALERAMTESASSLELTIGRSDGSRTLIGTSVSRLDVESEPLFLLTTRRLRLVREARIMKEAPRYTYEVEEAMGELYLVDQEGEAGAAPSPCRKRAELDARLCARCPAKAALVSGERETLAVQGVRLGTYHVMHATPTSAERVRLEIEEIDAATVTELTRSRIDHVCEEASLSLRERDVVSLLILGRSLEEIAMILHISRHTAKFHQANILEKLGADSRFDLIRVLL